MENKNFAGKNFDDIFWADQLAEKIIQRKKFLYSDSSITKPEEFVVKPRLLCQEFCTSAG